VTIFTLGFRLFFYSAANKLDFYVLSVDSESFKLQASAFNALHRTNFRGTIEPKKFAKSTSKEHEKGNWYKRTSGFLGLNLFLEKKI